jgi:hypothetical protein
MQMRTIVSDHLYAVEMDNQTVRADCDRTPHSDIVFTNPHYDDDGVVHRDWNPHSRKHRSAPDALSFQPQERRNESSDPENQTRLSELYSFGDSLDTNGGYSVPGEHATTTSSVDLIARTALSDFTNGQEGVFILVLDGHSARNEWVMSFGGSYDFCDLLLFQVCQVVRRFR